MLQCTASKCRALSLILALLRLPWIVLRIPSQANLWWAVASLRSKKATHPVGVANVCNHPGDETMSIGPAAKPTMRIVPTANTYTHLAMVKSWVPFLIFSHAACSWLAACVTTVVMSWSTFAKVGPHSPNRISGLPLLDFHYVTACVDAGDNLYEDLIVGPVGDQ